MAVCSSNGNRNPSPMSSRPNPNSNPNHGQIVRSHQSTERDVGGLRSSFSGKSSLIPSLHARGSNVSCSINGASDNLRRSSSGRDCMVSSRDNEHKENEKDPNCRHIRARSLSPSPALSRGTTKNFMSPTISAASKINPYPRKKVLSERNEAVRASASLLDGKFHFFSVDNPAVDEDSELALTENSGPTNNENISTSSAVVDLETERTECCGFSSEEPGSKADDSAASKFFKFEEPDMVVLSPEKLISFYGTDPLPSPETPKMGSFIKNANHSPCVIAPLDADPALPPYDPKTNWLSPRPQFLHYKPNPRIELYLSSGKRLDEGNSSDTSWDESSRGSMSEDSQVTEDASSDEMLAEESKDEDASSVEMVAEETKDEDACNTVSQEIESCQSEELEATPQVEIAAEEQPTVQISGAVIPPMPNKAAESEKEECEVVSSVDKAVKEQPDLQFFDSRIPHILDISDDRQPSLSKSRFISRSMVITFLFVLSLAVLPILVLHTPSSISTMLHPRAIVNLYNDSYMQLADMNLNVVLPNVGPWSVPFGNYLSEMSSWYREVERLRLLQLSNATSMHISSSNEQDVARFPVVDYTRVGQPEALADAEPVVVTESEGRLEMEERASANTTSNDEMIAMNSAVKGEEGDSGRFLDSFELESHAGVVANESSASLAKGSVILSSGKDETTEFWKLEQGETTQENHHGTVSDMQDELHTGNAEFTAASVNLELEETTQEKHNIVSDTQDKPPADHVEAMDQSEVLSYDEENHESCNDIEPEKPDKVPGGGLEIENDLEDHQMIAEDHDDIESEEPEEVPDGISTVEDKHGDHSIIDKLDTCYRRLMDQRLICVLCALLAAVIAYTLLMRKKPSSSSHVEATAEEEFSTRPEASKSDSSFHGSPSSHNDPIEMDMGSEPCPSEMSSLQKMSSSYYSRKGPVVTTDEAQSQERKTRRNNKRESLASSSSDHTIASTSYGSFTTYGIVHSKHGDEEVVTPVRRSSRLRNHQVTSP